MIDTVKGSRGLNTHSLLCSNLAELSPLAKPIGSSFIELRQVESTNNYAMGMVHARMAQHGTCVFAHEQTKGKGQRQKQWLSGVDTDIILSIILEPFKLAPSQQALFSMATALGVYRFFNSYAGAETSIKWPNDLYWRDRKAGGILIENVIQSHHWQWSVIGIGININQVQFPELARQPVSLKQITGRAFDPVVLSKELIGYLQTSFEQLIRDEASIREDYIAALYRINKPTAFRQGSRAFTGVVAGVASTGELIVQTPLEEYFGVGEIEWV